MSEPRVHRRVLLGGVAALLALVLTACLTADQTKVGDALNRDRTTHGRAELPINSDLTKKAQAWAEKLARDNTLSHSNLTQGLPGCYRSAGENVGYNSSIEAVQAGYMASADHRANVLNPAWTHVGVGAAQNGSRWFTVQVFLQAC